MSLDFTATEVATAMPMLFVPIYFGLTLLSPVGLEPMLPPSVLWFRVLLAPALYLYALFLSMLQQQLAMSAQGN